MTFLFESGEDPVSSDDEGSTSGKTGKSGMFSMFNFMKRQNAQSAVDNGKGIYLDDLNLESMDPETAALYFPSIMKEVRNPQGLYRKHFYFEGKF